MSVLTQTLSLAGLGVLLCGCDLSIEQDAATPAVDALRQSFTFKGQLPENFGIKTIVFYYPLKPELAECQRQVMGVGPGVFESSRKVESHAAEISNEPQSFSFNIPLKRSVKACDMRLARIDLNILAKFGEKDWQTTYANGGFRIREVLPEGAREFNKNGVLEIRGQCGWLFQESKTHLELDKILTCKGAGAYLPIEQLPGKTVSLAIQVNAEEEPSHDDTWIKFENGWKPCLPKPGGWISCQSPPLFKTFKMDGKTCTIYPTCTE